MTTKLPALPVVRMWQFMAAVAILPGMLHLVVLTAACLGICAPAIWVSEHLFDGTWSVPLLWAFVIAGPLLSVIAGLTLELWQGTTRVFGRACGIIAWVVLILGLATTLPLPWILVFE